MDARFREKGKLNVFFTGRAVRASATGARPEAPTTAPPISPATFSDYRSRGVGRDLLKVLGGKAQMLSEERARHSPARSTPPQPGLTYLQQRRGLSRGKQDRGQVICRLAR
jgi:hypothetical protein